MSFDSFPPTPGAATIDIDITSMICTIWSELRQREGAEVRLSWRETAVCASIIPLAHTGNQVLPNWRTRCKLNEFKFKCQAVVTPEWDRERERGMGKHADVLKSDFFINAHTCRQAVARPHALVLVLVLALVLVVVLFCPGPRSHSRSRPGAFTFYFRIIWKIRKCAARSQMTKRDMQTTKEQQQQRPPRVCVCLCIYVCVCLCVCACTASLPQGKKCKEKINAASRLAAFPFPPYAFPLPPPPLPSHSRCISLACVLCASCAYFLLFPAASHNFLTLFFAYHMPARDTGHTGMGEQQGGVGIIIWIIRHLRPAWTRPNSLPPPLSSSPCRLPVCLSAGCCARPGPGLVYLPPLRLSTSQLAARSFPRASRASNDENFVINK